MKNKNMWIIPILLGITFLLLEIPKQYYRYQDTQFMKESGESKYEIQEVAELREFQQKAEVFRNEKAMVEIGYVRDLVSYEFVSVFESLTQEFEKLTGGVFQKTIQGMKNPHVRGGTGNVFQVIQLSDTEKIEYVWKIGYFQFLISGTGKLEFYYDADTYKIFLVSWYLPDETDLIRIQVLRSLAEQYYGEVVAENFMVIQEECGGAISVFSEEELEQSKLYEMLTEYSGSFSKKITWD